MATRKQSSSYRPIEYLKQTGSLSLTSHFLVFHPDSSGATKKAIPLAWSNVDKIAANKVNAKNGALLRVTTVNDSSSSNSEPDKKIIFKFKERATLIQARKDMETRHQYFLEHLQGQEDEEWKSSSDEEWEDSSDEEWEDSDNDEQKNIRNGPNGNNIVQNVIGNNKEEDVTATDMTTSYGDMENSIRGTNYHHPTTTQVNQYVPQMISQQQMVSMKVTTTTTTNINNGNDQLHSIKACVKNEESADEIR